MSEISSGLVAVAEVGAGFSLRWTEPDYGCSCKHYDNLVRLSDAEAIIETQAERIKELETEFAGCSELLDNAERIMEQQSAALKMARGALDYIDSENAAQSALDIASQALAAINALKGEVE